MFWKGGLLKALTCLSLVVCFQLFDVGSLLAQQPNRGHRLKSTGDVTVDILAKTQFFRTGLRTAITEYERQSLPMKAWQTVLSLIPPLTWVRQAEAISSRPNHLNGSPGATTLDNVGYMMALPLEDVEREYKDVMSNSSLNLRDKLRFAEAVVSDSSADENRDNLFLIVWLSVVFGFVYRFRRTINPKQLFSLLSKRFQIFVTWTEANHILMGAVAIAALLVGFLLADGYNPTVGILGSLPFMSISLGPFEVPYRPVAIGAALVLVWAGFFIVNRRSRSI